MEVSGQSIFWALGPLGLNAMVQPTGQTLGFSKRYALMLRSSPIVCAVDCIITLIALIRYIWQGSSISTAVSQLTKSRFLGSTGATVRDNSLSALLQNPWLRLILFVGGTLFQTVKLCGLQGVPWAKALASMYLVPFLVFEILAFISKRNQYQGLRQDGLLAEPDHHDMPVSVARISGCLAIAVQIGLWIMVAHMISSGIDYGFRAEGFEPMGADIFNFFGFFYSMTPFVILLIMTSSPETAIPHFFRVDATPAVQSAMRTLWIVLTFAFELLFAGFFFYWATHFDGYVQALRADIIQPIYVVCASTLLSFLLFVLIPFLRLGLYRVGESSTCHWLAWHFLASNVAFAYSYYILAWDPHGTVAPGWTTYLG